MRKKSILQLFLILIIVLLLLLFFIKYFKKDDQTIVQNKDFLTSSIDKNSSSNFIENINYISSDSNGNKYQITANSAEIDSNLSDILFLKDVVAYIYTEDLNVIKITSDFGKYHTINYDTIFSIDVKVYYTNQTITGEYLDFSLKNNLAIISDNVEYIQEQTKLKADIIEMDIISKETKIFMNEVKKKVIIIGNK